MTEANTSHDSTQSSKRAASQLQSPSLERCSANIETTEASFSQELRKPGNRVSNGSFVSRNPKNVGTANSKTKSSRRPAVCTAHSADCRLNREKSLREGTAAVGCLDAPYGFTFWRNSTRFSFARLVTGCSSANRFSVRFFAAASDASLARAERSSGVVARVLLFRCVDVCRLKRSLSGSKLRFLKRKQASPKLLHYDRVF
jgi:hypothetical protein